MLTNETRRNILDRVKASGYPGGVSEAFRAAEQGIDVVDQFVQQQQLEQQQQAEQAQVQVQGQGQEMAEGNQSPPPPPPQNTPDGRVSQPNINNPIDNNQGHLVQSQNTQNVGIQSLPTGSAQGQVIQAKNGRVRRYENGGLDLENETKKRLPEKKVTTMYQGINSKNWYKEKEMELKHPCIGFLQGSVIWDKAKEMLTLTKVIESMPEVTFYWAGDGPYRDIILRKLKKYNNFQWLGPLEYPGKVREFLSSIDIYGLASGIDMSPLTLLEAQLMEKPVIASKVGGIPELMIDNETGFLVNKGNSEEWKEKISILLNDTKKQRKMGQNGKKFVKENFAWQIIAKEFKKTISEQLKL